MHFDPGRGDLARMAGCSRSLPRELGRRANRDSDLQIGFKLWGRMGEFRGVIRLIECIGDLHSLSFKAL